MESESSVESTTQNGTDDIFRRLVEARIKRGSEDDRAKHLTDYERRLNAEYEINRLANTLGERYSPNRAALETFEVYGTEEEQARQREVHGELVGIAKALPSVLAVGKGIIWYGSRGTGKDHLMAALLYRVAVQGESVVWLNGREYYADNRDSITRKRLERPALEKLLAPKVLAISDPLPWLGELTAFQIDHLAAVVDGRNRKMRCTWVTMNCESEEEAKERLTPPLWDRLQEHALILPCFWPSYREKPLQPKKPSVKC